jgi:hypothetical protein
LPETPPVEIPDVTGKDSVAKSEATIKKIRKKKEKEREKVKRRGGKLCCS